MEKYKNTKGVLSDVPYMTSCEWLIIVGNTVYLHIQAWPSREIAGKTHTFWFDCGRTSKQAEVGIRSSCTELYHIHRERRDPSLLLLCVK